MFSGMEQGEREKTGIEVTGSVIEWWLSFVGKKTIIIIIIVHKTQIDSPFKTKAKALSFFGILKNTKRRNDPIS